MDTYLCPGCDQEVPVGSCGCPRCNPPSKRRKRTRAAAHGRGRKQTGYPDGLDLPDDDFDYDAYIAREFGQKPHRRIGIAWYWWLTGAVLLGIFAAGVAGLLG